MKFYRISFLVKAPELTDEEQEQLLAEAVQAAQDCADVLGVDVDSSEIYEVAM